MKKYIYTAFIASGLLITGCSEDFLDRKPEATETQFLDVDAIKTPEDLQQLLLSVYDVTANTFGGQIQNLSELLGDNIDAPANQNDYIQVYLRRTDIFNGTISGVYRDAYIAIYRANQLISKKDDVEGITESEKLRIEAESRFLRAFCHHGILRLFAQPAGFTTDNSHPGIVMRMELSNDVGVRSTVKACYEKILEDLTFAEDNLPDDNSVYATKWAAKALKARIYFDLNDFTNAGQFANEVLSSGRFAPLDSLNRFTAGANAEQIFATVSYLGNGISDERGDAFLAYRSDNNTNPTMRASAEFFGYMNADTANPDLRGQNWLREISSGGNTTYGVAKYDRLFMWIPLLHVTEMMLTRAEAFASGAGSETQALEDLNFIRNRAGLSPYPPITGRDLVLAIRDERRRELCFEGDRTVQIKRIGALGEASLSRNAPWNCPGMVLQFPGAENTVTGFELNPTGGCE
jgi:tetratricopeptide (TPR) repeat protein